MMQYWMERWWCMDENGNPSFQKLQHYEDNTNLPIKYYVFDILFLNKKDFAQICHF